MESFRIKNLKSFKDSGTINIKPITLILGKNSCGKSSLVRILPLFKQTFEKSSSDPILWYSDYVDYGDFENAIRSNSQKNEIRFEFKFKKIKDEYLMIKRKVRSSNIIIKIEFCVKDNFLSELNFKYKNNIFNYKFERNSDRFNLIINNENISTSHLKYTFASNKLIPYIVMNNNLYNSYHPFDISYSIKSIFTTYGLDISWKEIEKLTFELNNGIKENNIKEKILKLSNNDLLINKNDKIYNDIVTFYIINILNEINKAFIDKFMNVQYIKPLRATASRYYRVQGLNIDNVDSNGDNVAMILHNMDKNHRQKFEKWCNENIGVIFKAEGQSPNISINIIENGNNPVNLTDSGFGYSQILPIVLSLWLIENKKKNDIFRKNGKLIYVIEQPELHLHPAMQAKIIRLIGKVVDNNDNVNFIIETHSETMMNELGSMINKESINNKKINIIIVEKENNISKAVQTKFNKQGMIEKWPIGFFSDRYV